MDILTGLGWTVAVILGFIFWYLASTFKYGMASGQLGRSRDAWVFECFIEEFKCNWLGMRKHREAFVKERTEGTRGVMCGRTKSYTHEEIREGNLYHEVYVQMCGGLINFWVTNLIVFLLPTLFAVFAFSFIKRFF